MRVKTIKFGGGHYGFFVNYEQSNKTKSILKEHSDLKIWLTFEGLDIHCLYAINGMNYVILSNDDEEHLVRVFNSIKTLEFLTDTYFRKHK